MVFANLRAIAENKVADPHTYTRSGRVIISFQDVELVQECPMQWLVSVEGAFFLCCCNHGNILACGAHQCGVKR
jgi:hypothetical protein